MGCIKHVDELVPDFHSNEIDNWFIERKVVPQLFKTHLQAPDLIAEGNLLWRRRLKGLVIYRNPVDSLVSFFHFKRRYPHTREQVGGDVNCFVRQNIGEWVRWHESWISCLEKGNVRSRTLLVSYEDISSETRGFLGEITRFAGLFTGNVEELEMAVRMCEFKVLQMSERLEEKHSGERFFRRGEIGGGQNEISEETLHFAKRAAVDVTEKLHELSLRLD